MAQIRKLDEKRLKKKVKITKLREQLSAAKEQKNYDDIEFTKLMTERQAQIKNISQLLEERDLELKKAQHDL